MKYFAYGSNMLRKRLEDRLGTVRDLGIGTLKGYDIKFNKASIDGTGKTNIIPSNEETVVGVVFDLTLEQFVILDRAEGGYHRSTLDIDINGETEKMITYIANETKIDNSLIPSGEYREFLIAGAIEHGFPDEYVNKIREI